MSIKALQPTALGAIVKRRGGRPDVRLPTLQLDQIVACAYNAYMAVTWDPRKAAANFKKHGVRFSDAEIVLSDPYALTEEDAALPGDRRFVSVGLDALGRIVVVLYGFADDDVRLISARTATPRERQQY